MIVSSRREPVCGTMTRTSPGAQTERRGGAGPAGGRAADRCRVGPGTDGFSTRSISGFSGNLTPTGVHFGYLPAPASGLGGSREAVSASTSPGGHPPSRRSGAVPEVKRVAHDSIPLTSTTLLRRLQHEPADQEAWAEFVRRYGPQVYRWCRRWRLQEADAEDVTQAVLVRLSARMRTFSYDPVRSFRA